MPDLRDPWTFLPFGYLFSVLIEAPATAHRAAPFGPGTSLR
jgi:hypothetical protein